MIVDWHAHYPMQVVKRPRSTLDQMRKVGGRATLGDRIRALIINVASRFASDKDEHSGNRITVDGMRSGGVGVMLSVLFRPFDEMDLSKPYAAPPASSYYAGLLHDLEAVEADIAEKDPAVVRFARDGAELEQCLQDGATAMVHCVEGGFHLGDGSDEIATRCSELARRGVAYVTVAHLFFRQVATNAPAIPFIPDPLYGVVFPQRGKDRLTPRGEAVVRGLVRNRILIDLSHMDPPAIAEVVRLLDDELDPDAQLPLVSTHAGYRFGRQRYMHDDETLREIKRRDGIVGLIMAQHQLNDGIRRDHTDTFEQSLEVIFRHVDKIAEVTGSHRHVAIGTDFDGFIKPTMSGLDTTADLARLDAALHDRYGDDAELMTSQNSLRVLRRLWSAAGPPGR
ncbi:dipeptidase [Conexibacter sp. CPCC 206217]|uniref:dipeptidase n=1 Tax=Conexibacter sp. CPCC 206217 TaxID=3064574 RepID=UPI00271C19AC|nr:membrane dipeptidase [Conexibacter sp. CPCC 206217]MDO8209574.1 membrane dipeptidase [Conexibacter sp. CPCC 206217]